MSDHSNVCASQYRELDSGLGEVSREWPQARCSEAGTRCPGLPVLTKVRLAQAGQVNFATNMFRFAAMPFREYEGYRPEWAIDANTQ